MKKKISDVFNILKKYRQKIIVIFLSIILFLSIVFLGYYSIKFYTKTFVLEKTMTNLKINSQENLKELVIEQSKLTSKAIRKSFQEYQRIYKPNWFMKKNGGYLFHNKQNDKDIIFYPNTMELRKDFDNLYKIIDKETNDVIMRSVAPEWNREILNNFLNITTRNIRLFGPEGDPIIIDQRTKEILVDDSFNCADTPEVMGYDGRRYMDLDHKHRNNMNPEASKWVIDNVLTWDNDQLWIYFFTAPNITVNELEKGEAFNFKKNPMQISENQGREIGYTITIKIKNKYGITLPLRIMFGAQEYEFTSYFKETYNYSQKTSEILYNNRPKVVIIPMIAFFIIILQSFLLIYLYFWKNDNCSSKIDYDDLAKKIKQIEKLKVKS